MQECTGTPVYRHIYIYIYVHNYTYMIIYVGMCVCAKMGFSKTSKNHQVSSLQPQLMFQLRSIWRLDRGVP